MKKKEPGLIISIIPVITVLTLLLLSLLEFKVDIQIPLIVATIVAAIIAGPVLGLSWKEVEKGMKDSIMNAMQAILICVIIGLILGSWIAGGIVPSLIYYGLKLLSPRFFLLTCLLVCSVVSIATGSSWTTAGTMGIAMIGIGAGMAIPPAVTAGCVVSGAYFGDKMSPLSDTTNLAPAVAGTTLFAHIRHMVWTTGISYIGAIIFFAALNFKYTQQGMNFEIIKGVTDSIEKQYVVSPFLVFPVLIVIGMIVFKIPAIPGLMLNVAIGVICAVVVQGLGVHELGDILQNGVISDTGNRMVDELLSRGGMQNMMWTVSLILCSLSFGGVMFCSGMMESIARSILRIAKGRGGLIAATLVTAGSMNIICGEQYLSLLITGKMFRDEYRKRDLAPQNLSRTLEDSGTILSPLIPWTTCAVAMSTYMGVSTLSYLPFCFFNLINPIVAAILGFTGISIKKTDEINKEDIVDIS